MSASVRRDGAPLRRLQAGLLTMAAIVLVGVAGYRASGSTWIDALYMVVITVSTVGYEEVPSLHDAPGLKLFTILLIIFGVWTAIYIFGGVVQMMAEGEINRALGLRRQTREIERLHDHVIVCGYGRMGEVLAKEFRRHNTPHVFVEREGDRINEATEDGLLAITDDATEEDALLAAGVERAKTLVTTLPGDAENVFIVLTARNLNPNLHIIARGELPSTEKKLIQAGADRVVLPAATGAMRMAAMITRPSAVELIELVAGRQIAEVQADELDIPAKSPLVGSTVRDSHVRGKHGLLIVAVRHPGREMVFNPGGDLVFEAGDSVIVIGKPDDIARFRRHYHM